MLKGRNMENEQKTEAQQPEEVTGPQVVEFEIGAVLMVEGVRLRLSYVNEGKRRLTFVPVDSELIVTEKRDPVVGVAR
jgi:hypothetical protein